MSRTTTQDEKALFQGVCDLLNNPDNGLIDLTCNNVGIPFLRENKDALGLNKPDDMDEERWLKLQKNWIIRPMRKQRKQRETAEAQAQQAEAIAEEARVRERVRERVLELRFGEEEDMKAFEGFLGPDALAKLDPVKKLEMLDSFVAKRQERLNATEERVEGVKDKKHQRDMEKERIEMEKERIEMDKERIRNEKTVTSQKIDLTSQLMTESKELTSETLQHVHTPQRNAGANMNSGGGDDDYPTENIEYAGYGSSVKRSHSSFENTASPPARASEVQSGTTPSHKRAKTTGRTLFSTAPAAATSVGIPTGAAGGPPQIVSNSAPAVVTHESSVSGGTPASFDAPSVKTPVRAATPLAPGLLFAPGTVFSTEHGSQQVRGTTVSNHFVQSAAVPAATVGAAHAPATPPPFFAFGGTLWPAEPAGGGSSDDMDWSYFVQDWGLMSGGALSPLTRTKPS